MIEGTVANCLALIERNAPLMMRVGDDLRPDRQPRVSAEWRPPIPRRTITRMKRLRADGLTIGEIARRVRVSWRTAWKLSAPIIRA